MNERSPAEVVFFSALAKAGPAERAAYLDEACAGNDALRRRVESLLAAHAQVGEFLERPVAEAGGVAASDAAADLSFLAPSCEPWSLGRLDQYEVLEVVGRGGTGVVLRARDTKLERVVALKVLAAPLAASGTARRRFAREARAAAAVRDEHAIAIHAVSDEGPTPYLVMEYIEGENLETLVRRRGPLEVAEVLRIGIQVARGLAAAHRQGLIHRDVKPANVLLENGVQRVKLTDFGLARAADDASLTQSGLIAGTPLYMAPEQVNGRPIDFRADLFSLGSVLYELCTGHRAFRAPNTAAVLRRVSDTAPRPVREVNPDIPESLARLIDRLHAKEPAERPSSAAEVADLLTAMLTGGHAPLRRRASSRAWLRAATVLVLLSAGLGMGEATGLTNVRGTVLRLFSPDGTLIVEVDDPGVSVAVEGADVVITGAGAKEIRLKPGQYKVEASKDGKIVRQELVTVQRNGRQVVRITRETDPTAESQRWATAVASMLPEKQVEAVARRLQELNPGFERKLAPTIENGVVTRLQFRPDGVEDLSPVRALQRLESLECRGTFPRSRRLSDLTPLRGMRLKYLGIYATDVADLSPLRGMPLIDLDCGETQVSELSPLNGMKLQTLTLQSTAVTNLTPLRGMPLRWLDLHHAERVRDLGPLEGMPLEYLNLTGLPIADMSVVGRIKTLEWLILDFTPVADLTPLRELRLKRLAIPGTRVTDLSPLQGQPLTSLVLDYRPEYEALLRSFPALEWINDKPAAEFWKQVPRK